MVRIRLVADVVGVVIDSVVSRTRMDLLVGAGRAVVRLVVVVAAVDATVLFILEGSDCADSQQTWNDRCT